MPYLTDEIGAAQAAKYKLTDEYWMARKHGLNIIEALEDWDPLDEEFLKKYDGYSVPPPTFKEKLLNVWYIIRYPFLQIKFWILYKLGR